MAFTFANVSDTQTTAVDPNAAATLAAMWVYNGGGAGTGVFLSQKDGTGTGRSWIYTKAATHKIYTYIGGTELVGGVIGTGSWVHVGIAWLGTGAGSTINLYKAGALDTSGTEDPEAATGDLVLGSDKNESQDMDGVLAEVGIWTGLTSASDVLAIVASLAKGYSPLFFPGSLVHYMPMVRAARDVVFGGTYTQFSAVSAHPRIIYPSKAIWTPYTAGAAPEGLSIPVAIHNYRRRRVAG